MDFSRRIWTKKNAVGIKQTCWCIQIDHTFILIKPPPLGIDRAQPPQGRDNVAVVLLGPHGLHEVQGRHLHATGGLRLLSQTFYVYCHRYFTSTVTDDYVYVTGILRLLSQMFYVYCHR